MNKCPRCSSEISKYSKTCPRCGLPVNQMEEFVKRFGLSDEEGKGEEEQLKAVNSKEEKKRLKQEKKKAKKEEKKARKERESKSDTNFSDYTVGGAKDEDYLEDDSYSERKRKRKEKRNRLEVDVDAEGKFNIDTADVEIVGAETGKLIEERFEQSYSVKKSRGDYRPPKIKWWEIYKISDRYFARRKVKKEVNKAARIKPSFISKTKLLLLAIFFGWCGAHNFYAKNKKKGFFTLFCLFIWVGVVALAERGISFFQSIEISIGGLAGFIDLFLWVTDVVNIIFNRFRYRLQIDKFLEDMNVETRAKLGEKYIDLELYHKPWWFRLKVWFQKKRRNWQEYKRDRRQANIDKQKRKLAEKAEKDKIEREVYEFEHPEEKDNLSSGTAEETDVEPAEETPKQKRQNKGSSKNNSKNVASKANEEKENIATEAEEKEEEKVPQKKPIHVSQTRKYPKTVKNTKAKNKKKK